MKATKDTTGNTTGNSHQTLIGDSDVNTRVHVPDEALLHSEIRFWRELIESKAASADPRETTERMQQALALAEYRLANGCGNSRPV